MASDLTSISAPISGSREQHLLSSEYAQGAYRHLTVVRQTAAWNNKQLVATPLSARFIFAWANGIEAYPSTWAGPNVYNDTNTLISDVNSDIAAASFGGTMQKALFNYYCRRNEPSAIFRGQANPESYCGHGRDILALRFSLRGLPLARATSFSAYVRAYMPSVLLCPPDTLFGDAMAGASNAPPWGDAAKFDVWLADTPTKADANTPTQLFDVWPYCNNGFAPTGDVMLGGVQGRDLQAATYDPFDVALTAQSGDAVDQSTRVFQELDANNDIIPYYHDFELTGDCKAFLANHMGAFWMMFAFRGGNAFSDGQSGVNHGLQAGYSLMMYIQRFELVLNVTSTTFN